MNATFGSRLRELRVDKELTITNFAEQIGISQPTVTSYENERTVPNLYILNDLADFFGVSTDYLACRTDNRKTNYKKSIGKFKKVE